MKKTAVLLLVCIILCLTSCITTKTTSAPMQMKSDETSAGKVVLGQMSNRFKVHYNIVGKQRPSDEELLNRITSMTQKKYGASAKAVDIVFTRQVVDTWDLLELVTDSPGFSDTDVYIIANWNVVN